MPPEPLTIVADKDRDDASTVGLYELLTVDEVAALLKVSKSWVYEHTRTRGIPHGDRLPHVKIGQVRAIRSASRSRVS